MNPRDTTALEALERTLDSMRVQDWHFVHRAVKEDVMAGTMSREAKIVYMRTVLAKLHTAAQEIDSILG